MVGASSFKRVPEKLLVPRNMKKCKKRHDVFTLLWQLRCQHNTSDNNVSFLAYTVVVIAFLWRC